MVMYDLDDVDLAIIASTVIAVFSLIILKGEAKDIVLMIAGGILALARGRKKPLKGGL